MICSLTKIVTLQEIFAMTLPDVKTKCNTHYVYEKYKAEILELIAYTEVYEHDLPAEIMAQMAELFQTIALCETDNDFESNDRLQQLLEDTFHKMNRCLNKHTIYVILQKIKQYKIIFKSTITKVYILAKNKNSINTQSKQNIDFS